MSLLPGEYQPRGFLNARCHGDDVEKVCMKLFHDSRQKKKIILCLLCLFNVYKGHVQAILLSALKKLNSKYEIHFQDALFLKRNSLTTCILGFTEINNFRLHCNASYKFCYHVYTRLYRNKQLSSTLHCFILIRRSSRQDTRYILFCIQIVITNTNMRRLCSCFGVHIVSDYVNTEACTRPF